MGKGKETTEGESQGDTNREATTARRGKSRVTGVDLLQSPLLLGHLMHADFRPLFLLDASDESECVHSGWYGSGPNHLMTLEGDIFTAF